MKTTTLFLILSFFLLSCGEDDLPKPTQNGSGTFACKVDGKIFKPKSDDFKLSSTIAGLDENALGISGIYSVSGEIRSVGFRIQNFLGKGTYILDTEDISYGRYRYNLEEIREYRTNASNLGRVDITHFDQAKKIVSGTFDFKAQDPESKEVVHVSEGRFDLYYD